jgi:hypothetical protein
MIPPFKVFILIVSLASVALADDFKTVDGKEYKNAKVSRVEPDQGDGPFFRVNFLRILSVRL